MATILLSAAGAAIGSSIGGSVLGLSMTAVGRFMGATLGRVIDQRLMGQGSETVETGRIDRFRLTGAGEGAAIAEVFGRMRVGGQIIWATEFTEHVTTRGGGGGGKGAAPAQPKIREYSYSVSLALALCEGEIAGVTRLWADGAELPLADLDIRVYRGTRDQQPDPLIEAVEGAGAVPAYRGTAYLVIEDLDLGRFGSRVPQFSAEVVRPSTEDDDVPALIRGVAMIPGTGEYALAPEPEYLDFGGGSHGVANVNTPSEASDFATSFGALQVDLPQVRATSLVVSWFGDDLRCDRCTLRPKVEQKEFDGRDRPWRVAGLGRDDAQAVPRQEGGVVYGGTPSDASVIGAIRHMRDAGQAVLLYPFILMEQLAGNGREDPWTGASDQPALPWRGRITTSLAPLRSGSPDGTAAARAEVAAFFGTANATDFAVSESGVTYTGPDEWGFRRFILHHAALAAAAGGVDSFTIGSEMRGLTQIRDDLGFPAVDQLIALAAEVRALLPDAKLGYAADWSEYFGYHPQDGSGDLRFHLDPLWADPNIDFIGIDNYMPLSDWRDGDTHADVAHGACHDLDYLMANVAGGEGYDWYYPSSEARAAQRREPIRDGAHGEDWVWRYKDLRGWWSNRHHERIGGVRQETPTAWQPGSKPIWFTELGCPAVDKGTNQPNVFVDPKSSESHLPYHSSGRPDALIQRQYLRAMHLYWGDPDHNPRSEVYDGRMVDMSRAFVWAWDARPYPWFPGKAELWADAPNHRLGHWITGRSSDRSLASVVAEICAASGLTEIDTTRLYGTVRGYAVPQVADARARLQPLMLAYGFDAVEKGGALQFVSRTGTPARSLDPERLVAGDEATLSETRAAPAEEAGRVRVGFIEAGGDHEPASEEAVLPDEATHAVSDSELPLLMSRAEARQTAERWLSETRIARDSLRFALPPSLWHLGAGDIVTLPREGGDLRARIDRVETGTHRMVDAVRIEPDTYIASDLPEAAPRLRPFAPATPVLPLFLDLPLLTGDEVPHAPHLALTARPWPGSAALYGSATGDGFELLDVIAGRSTIGRTLTPLFAGPSGRVQRGAELQLEMLTGQLAAISDEAFLAGGNALAIGDGSPGAWEVLQFRDARLGGPRTWFLGHLLRGQAGTDGVMPEVWPAGSWVVRLDGTPRQIPLTRAERRVSKHYRVGPARRGYDDPSYTEAVHAFDGIGLRPYAPAHLRARPQGGDFRLSWVRRTRLDGDDWSAPEVPLGEESEAYLLRVMAGETVLREVTLGAPAWTYPAALRAADGAASEIRVAQISARFGPGPAARLAVG
ncbi:baseplate multidomain protein megatron [Litorisediminicola beolgyonensis]|uniref:Glycoside hydrolase/phage tail family protein n=1 Tax=Litorisediminicola beolgyonensis TaxID=1173614 RepID=A0ABW3ZPW5_9RHOB